MPSLELSNISTDISHIILCFVICVRFLNIMHEKNIRFIPIHFRLSMFENVFLYM